MATDQEYTCGGVRGTDSLLCRKKGCAEEECPWQRNGAGHKGDIVGRSQLGDQLPRVPEDMKFSGR